MMTEEEVQELIREACKTQIAEQVKQQVVERSAELDCRAAALARREAALNELEKELKEKVARGEQQYRDSKFGLSDQQLAAAAAKEYDMFEIYSNQGDDTQ